MRAVELTKAGGKQQGPEQCRQNSAEDGAADDLPPLLGADPSKQQGDDYRQGKCSPKAGHQSAANQLHYTHAS